MSDKPRYYVYWIVRAIVLFLFKIWFRVQAVHPERIPRAGGCLIASNHASYLDPPLVGTTVKKRVVHFMARDTLFRFPLMRWFYENIGTISIDRTRGDLSALKRAIQVMKAGHVVCLFPEGTRTLDGRLQEPKAGVGFLIAKAGVPVIPVYIQGSYQAYPKGASWMKPVKIRVIYGEPVNPAELLGPDPKKPDYEQIGREIMKRIALLAGA